MNSIFSKIISGEIPCYKVAEDENNFAFLDINPVARGHVLVIPKVEIDYLFDIDDKRLASLIIFAKKIAKAMDASLKPIRTGIIVEGLEVPHAHIHLIPMYKDRTSFSLGSSIELSSEDMKKIAASIQAEVQL